MNTAMTAAGLQRSGVIYDRLKGYQALIPMNNAAFKTHAGIFLDKPAASISGAGKSLDYGEGWYSVWLNSYAEAEGQAAQTAMNNILSKYFPTGRP